MGGDGVPSRSRAPGEYKGLSCKAECRGPNGISFPQLGDVNQAELTFSQAAVYKRTFSHSVLSTVCEFEPYTVPSCQENGEPAIA